jgi:excisionase family DNA binding protein
MDELLTVQEVARICRVHEVTIRRHIAQGRLKAVRVGRSLRVRPQDVEAYVEPSVGDHQEDGEPQEYGRPLPPDDPLVSLIGIYSDPEGADLSSNNYKYFPEAFDPRE